MNTPEQHPPIESRPAQPGWKVNCILCGTYIREHFGPCKPCEKCSRCEAELQRECRDGY